MVIDKIPHILYRPQKFFGFHLSFSIFLVLKLRFLYLLFTILLIHFLLLRVSLTQGSHNVSYPVWSTGEHSRRAMCLPVRSVLCQGMSPPGVLDLGPYRRPTPRRFVFLLFLLG